MEVALQFIIPVFSLIISAIAAVYAIRAFNQSLKINNENIIFQEKIKAYKDIVFHLNDFLNCLQLNLYHTRQLVQKKNIDNKDITLIYDYADEIDDKAELLDNHIKSWSTILPSNITEELDSLMDMLFKEKSIADMDIMELNHLDKLIDDYLSIADKTLHLFRNDINSEELNNTLFNRIGRLNER